MPTNIHTLRRLSLRVPVAILIGHCVGPVHPQTRTKAISQGRVLPPFVLDEISFGRVVALLQTRIDQQANNKGQLHFSVVHGDGTSDFNNTIYETDNAQEVLRDANTTADPIASITITAMRQLPKSVDGDIERAFHDFFSDSQPKLEVTFAGDGIQFLATGPSGDWVFSTRAELETLLKSMERSDHHLGRLRVVVGVGTALILFFAFVSINRNRYESSTRHFFRLLLVPVF
jgi:hypothetical protein